MNPKQRKVIQRLCFPKNMVWHRLKFVETTSNGRMYTSKCGEERFLLIHERVILVPRSIVLRKRYDLCKRCARGI